MNSKQELISTLIDIKRHLRNLRNSIHPNLKQEYSKHSEEIDELMEKFVNTSTIIQQKDLAVLKNLKDKINPGGHPHNQSPVEVVGQIGKYLKQMLDNQ